MRRIVAVVILLVACVGVMAAPVPAPRVAKKVELLPSEHLIWEDCLGEFVMDWGGSPWDTKFNQNGSYECISRGGGSKYVGNWRIDFGELEVTEAVLDENGAPGAFSTWRIRWDRDKKNNLVGCQKDPKSGRNVKVEPTGTVIYNDNDNGVTFGLKRKARAR